jgi:hypothetical protein
VKGVRGKASVNNKLIVYMFDFFFSHNSDYTIIFLLLVLIAEKMGFEVSLVKV